MITGIYGMNIAVKDLAAATKTYEGLFGVKATPLGEGDFAFPGLVGATLDIKGFHINLIASTQPNTSVAAFLERKGEGVFLLSVAVDAIDQDVPALKAKGMQFVLPETVAGEFGAVNFIHPKSLNGVQVEIYQPAED